MSRKDDPKELTLPRHIAIIMDGNGRWAKKRGLPRVFGHRAAIKTVREVVEECAKIGIQALTLYAFSTENWARPSAEIRALMGLLRLYLRKELENLTKNNIRFRTIGDTGKLPEQVRKDLRYVTEKTAANSGLTLVLALNYGSRQEIVRAVNCIIQDGQKRVTEETIQKNLDTSGLPDPDLLIRTSGELRISNFLLWQIAYTELFFTKVLWPDFRARDLHEAITSFKERSRRFGGL
jgi:undecaprenyl diphosphate synthase